MSAYERFARFSDRIFDKMRDRRAFSLSEDQAVEGDLESLRGHQYALLVTFRRTGEGVPTPVWFGLDEHGRAYVKTRHDVGKVKRLRNDSRVLIAASNARGRPRGQVIKATGRVLPNDEWPHAEAALASAYGSSRRFFERVAGGPDELAAYLEITAGR